MSPTQPAQPVGRPAGGATPPLVLPPHMTQTATQSRSGRRADSRSLHSADTNAADYCQPLSGDSTSPTPSRAPGSCQKNFYIYPSCRTNPSTVPTTAPQPNICHSFHAYTAQHTAAHAYSTPVPASWGAWCMHVYWSGLRAVSAELLRGMRVPLCVFHKGTASVATAHAPTPCCAGTSARTACQRTPGWSLW